MEKNQNILFTITRDQAEAIAAYFDEDIDELTDYEICEMLDEIIDEIDMRKD